MSGKKPFQINFFDVNTGMDPYVNMHWPEPSVQYIKPPVMEFDGISVFTDEYCFDPIVDRVKSKYKIAWAFESPVIKPHLYQYWDRVAHKFDKLYICNPDTTDAKQVQSYFGACWVVERNCQLYYKHKLLSIVASNKNYAEGHKLRHELIAQKLHPELELWGSGYNRFSDAAEDRVKPFQPYMYVIAVENCRYNGYFTDKIVDCFATGCIPIYWGNPRIGDLFNLDGMYIWNTIDELKEILKRIGPEDYASKRLAIEDNFSRFREYASPDKWMCDNCYQNLI